MMVVRSVFRLVTAVWAAVLVAAPACLAQAPGAKPAISPAPIATPVAQITGIIPNSFVCYSNASGSQPLQFTVTGGSFPQKGADGKERVALDIGGARAKTLAVSDDGASLFASEDATELAKLTSGQKPVTIYVDGTPIAATTSAGAPMVTVAARSADGTSLVWLLVISIVVVIFLTLIFVRFRPGAIFIDPVTRTVSLSRTQFAWWTGIITICYVFLLSANWWISGNFIFPSIAGFTYTFLISVTTLVAADATTSAIGSKGAGPINPALSDLVMQGGVLAPERLQQVIWNVIIGVAFVVTTLNTFLTSGTLPTIPAELLALMGFSSAGYIGGKIARGPGPVISSAILGGTSLTISGDHLSQGAKIITNGAVSDNSTRGDAGITITIDGAPVPPANVITLIPDPDQRSTYAMSLRVDNVDGGDKGKSATVTNADGQQAVCVIG